MIIKEIIAKKIKNSRKEDTIQIIVKTDQGIGIGSAPSGASKSKFEVAYFPIEGVDKSIEFINTQLNYELKDFSISEFNDFSKLEIILKKYDDTKRWEKIGGNTVIALEFAILHALSKGSIWKFLNPLTDKLPRPLGNCIGGGKHIENGTDFQEFLLMSVNAPSFTSTALANRTIFKLLKKPLKKFLLKRRLTDEGAWAPNLNTEQILDILTSVVEEYNKHSEFRVNIGIDVAASSLWDGKYYIYKDKKLTKKEQIKYIIYLVEKYKLVYMEDPLEETDFSGFAELTKKLKHKCIICGDDLISTNLEKLKKAIEHKSITGIIIKPNQIGSIIKTKEVIELAKKEKIYPVLSHRSGETMDSTISQLAVAFNSPLIKCGIYGKEREVKIKELKNIENEMKKLKSISKHL